MLGKPKMWLQAISLSLLAVSSHALTTTAAQRPVQALQRFLDDVTTTSAARVATDGVGIRLHRRRRTAAHRAKIPYTAGARSVETPPPSLLQEAERTCVGSPTLP